MSDNPCLSCGACCAHFRVSFYWAEADDAPGGQVPVQLTERMHAHLRCMKGTNGESPRCIALKGEIGKQVACAIYELRPSACREFNMLEEDGTPNERCHKLRAQIGLV